MRTQARLERLEAQVVGADDLSYGPDFVRITEFGEPESNVLVRVHFYGHRPERGELVPISKQLLSRLRLLEQRFGTSGGGVLYAIIDDFADEEDLDAQVEALRCQAEAGGNELCAVIVHLTTEPAKPVKVHPGALLEEAGPEPPKVSPVGLSKRPRPKRAQRPEPEPEPEQPKLTASQRRRQEAFARWRRGD